MARFWRTHRLFLLFSWALTATIAAVNALSTLSDRAGRVAAWEPWAWEGTSAIGWALLVPAIGFAALRLRPPRVRWGTAAAVHAGLSLPASLAHVGVMAALRSAIYAAHGVAYDFGPVWPTLAYEYRKDALSYVLVTLGFLAWDVVRRARAGVPPAIPASLTDTRLTVRDGARTHLIAPAEIGYAQAAGNYVELHTARGPVLHRTSLAALEVELGAHGFARVHRSRLVRLAAVCAIEPTASGDFELLLEDGTRIGGSRRFRSALDPYTKL